MATTLPSSLQSGLLQIVGDLGLLTGDDAAPYEAGARYGAGRALCVVRPASVEQVQAVVSLCAARRVRVVVQGANTGLTGASSPDASGEQVLLSMGRLRSHCEVDVAGRTVSVDAGVTLDKLNAALRPHGLWFPVDLGANPQIGGMVAANTGGTRLIRHGDVRHNLMAVEAVLFKPAGERVRFGRPLRKDNTGLDLKQLFVGASGTTGVITRAVLEVQPLPRQSATALIAPAAEDAVIPLLLQLESQLGDFLSAFEGMSSAALRSAVAHVPGLRMPFEAKPPEFAILIALESSSSPALTGLDLQEVLNNFLQERFGILVADAILGSGDDLWRLRHAISEGTRRLGKPITFDISVPRARLMAFRRAAREIVQKDWPFLQIFDFGHVADGGMHFNLVWPSNVPQAFDVVTADAVRERIYRLVVQEFGGSFSAEHGIGPHNTQFYERYASRTQMSLSGGIQKLLDPQRLCRSVDFDPASTAADPVFHT